MTPQRQPQRVPPPITFGPELLDGSALLEEQSGQTALALWRLARHLKLLAEVPEDCLADVRPADDTWKSLLQDLPEELNSLLELPTRARSPSRYELSELAERVGNWADRHGRLGTALEFTQSASLLNPDVAALANATGRLARRRGEYARAESWYRHAVWIARRQQDRKTYARAYLGIGIVHMLRGNHPAARVSLIRGLRAAKRSGSRDLVAAAYHELTVWAMRADKPSEVLTFARLATKAYEPGNDRLLALAHDVALTWMKHGSFAEALQVFEAIPSTYGEPTDQISRAGARARAAAALGKRETYEEAWADAMILLRNPATAQARASCYLYLAHAARSIGEMDRAKWAATIAREVAEPRNETKVLHEADALLESASRRGSGVVSKTSAKPNRRKARLAQELAAAIAVAGAD